MLTSFKFAKDFAVGADISWVPQMQKGGFVFRDKHGAEQDVLLTLKDYNMDTVRLRTWVNPSSDPHAGHCSAEEVLAFALKCKEAGYRLMLNFHYSDSWCDPGKQHPPAAWAHLETGALTHQLYDYTFETMTLFSNNGVFLEWVQIGNETNPGMMLPMGSTDNWEDLTKLYNAGHDAVKAVSPETTTIIHLAEVNLTDFCIDYFDNLERCGCRYDMMGFSVYPYWAEHYHQISYETCMEAFTRSMREIPARFGKDVMLVETGGLDIDEAGSRKLFADLLKVMERQPKCKGILLWEPQGASVWSDYPLNSWRADGSPSAALEVFNSIQK
jgi:arabinogalactan endo-1,4-beta-galactosidase